MKDKKTEHKTEHPKCELCGYNHFSYDDGFDYLSCMLALKLKDKETNKRLQKVSD